MKRLLLPGFLLLALAALGLACGGAGVETPPALETQSTETPAAPAESSAPSPASEPAPTAAPVPSQPAPRPAGRTSQPTPQPAPAPAPQPEAVTMTVPAGTTLDVEFIDSVSSNESLAGDAFRVRVVGDVVQDGVPVVPAGSVVLGTVLEAKPIEKKIGGKARLGLEFHTLELTSGRSASVSAVFAQEGKSETKKDAATIGGATAGGALLGRLLKKGDKDKGTLIGAAVGAAAGTAIAAKTEGQEVIITSGTVITLQLDQPATVTMIP